MVFPMSPWNKLNGSPLNASAMLNFAQPQSLTALKFSWGY